MSLSKSPSLPSSTTPTSRDELPVWPWLLMAGMAGLMAALLMLGASAANESGDNSLSTATHGSSSTVTPLSSASSNTATASSSYGSVVQASAASPVSSTSTDQGGIRGFFNSFFGEGNSSETADNATTNQTGSVAIPATATGFARSSVMTAATTGSNTATSNVTTNSNTLPASGVAMREVPNEQRAQPGDDSAYLNDEAPENNSND